MATFYGQVEGCARTTASRRGSYGTGIRASVQSWNDSIIMRMYYDKEENLCVRIMHDSGSSFYGNSVFDGTVDEFLDKLK